MHICDDVLSPELMIGTNVLAVAGVAVGLYKTDYERVPRVGVLASVFFVASLVHINIGPSSVHLLLNGLLGFLLGWSAFPALAAALFLQAILFGFGGVTALGANVLNTAVPALCCFYLFSKPCRCAKRPFEAAVYGALAGSAGVVLTCAMLALSLYLSNKEAYGAAIVGVTGAHLPVMIIEAVVVGAAAGFLYKVRLELLYAPSAHLPVEEVGHHG